MPALLPEHVVRYIMPLDKNTIYDGLPNPLYRNRGNGTFEDVSEKSGIARHIGKGMSLAFADYDADGWLDVFVTNDTLPNFLFRNLGNGRFEEAALLAGAGVSINGKAISSRTWCSRCRACCSRS